MNEITNETIALVKCILKEVFDQIKCWFRKGDNSICLDYSVKMTKLDGDGCWEPLRTANLNHQTFCCSRLYASSLLFFYAHSLPARVVYYVRFLK